MKKLLQLVIVALFFLSGCALTQANNDNESKDTCKNVLRYTFSWSHKDPCQLQPRGGTSKGAPVKLDQKPSKAWLSLREQGIADLERDRRAILAMAGGYRASFEFIETIGYVANHEPPRPYQSWGTEYVYVVIDEPHFIRLQHIMVMVMLDEKGNQMPPMVMKHWRQDWRYEQSDYLVYVGNSTWRSEEKAISKGTWTQSVYQVDDSPRYASHGRWQHYPNFSTWISEETWRPLPRREYSVRQDYQVLIGTNRHTILPHGWVQEEENYKVALDEEGKLTQDAPYLAKEIGVNRYEKIVEFDFSPANHYWQQTAPFWFDVTQFWDKTIKTKKQFTLNNKSYGVPLFMPLFNYADKIKQNKSYDTVRGQQEIDKIIQPYFK